MKRDLTEKTQLLREAYKALESIEQEHLREKSQYESRIESLKLQFSSLKESQLGVSDSSCDVRQQQQQNTLEEDQNGSFENFEVGDRSRALLSEAFGSMNLGKQDDLLVRIEELQQEVNAKDEQVSYMQCS